MQTDEQKKHDYARIYDWASYYESALCQLKRENVETMLAIEASRAQADTLRENMVYIKNNPLWKLFMPVRGICDAWDRLKRSVGECANAQLTTSYEELIFELKHPYRQWIEQIEKKRFESYAGYKAQTPFAFYTLCIAQCSGTGLKEYLHRLFSGWKCDGQVPAQSYVIFISDDGTVREEAETVLQYYFGENPEALVAYADEDYIADVQSGGAWRMHPWFKPDWSPETMLSFFYFGAFTVIRGDLLQKLTVGEDSSGEVNLYDLVLQATEKTTKEQILHIDEVLFHNIFSDYTQEELIQASCNRNWDIQQRIEAVLQRRLENGWGIWGCSDAFSCIKNGVFKRRGIYAHLERGMDPTVNHVVYDTVQGEPLVSAVILSKDHPDALALCLASLVERTDYNNLEIIVVDNGSSDENRIRVNDLEIKYKFKYVYKKMDFNFSAQCNLGVKEAKGDVILFINDDIEVIEKNWLRYMVGQAVQPDIGAVGARLLYAGSNKIQHAGITNLGVGPSHKLIMCPDDRIYDHGRNRFTYNMLGVTAACLVVQREKYEEVGGLCEMMKVAYNDVDFCFSLYEKGYRNVLRNDALLYHYESLSRGSDVVDDDKWFRFLDEKKRLYERHPLFLQFDPYYHRDLADDSAYYICNYKCDADDKDKYGVITPVSAQSISKAKDGEIHLEVDHAGFVPRDHARNLDDYWVSGWSFLPGADQCKYKKRLLFKSGEKELWEGIFFVKYRKDVEEMFAGEKHISGAGFSLRFKKGVLAPGNYSVGMFYEDLENGKRYVTWSDQILVVE